MRISIANEQNALDLDEGRFTREFEVLATAAGWSGEISVALVMDGEMRDLNRRFLEHDYPTDVLAFPLGEAEGEIVVSAERALTVAAEYGADPLSELMLYVVHGLLHLMGYDDHDPDEARRMHAQSLKLLRGLGYRNRISSRERKESRD